MHQKEGEDGGGDGGGSSSIFSDDMGIFDSCHLQKKWREEKGKEGLAMEERGRGNVVFLGQKFFNT